MKSAVASPALPAPVGPYSPAVRCGDLLFISGQTPVDPATGRPQSGDIRTDTRRILENLRTLLGAAGLTLDHVVRTTVFLADMNEFAAMNECYAKFVAEPPPARATVQVARLPRDVRIEIDAIAVIA